VSVEALSWALNLAPVPCDRGGKRNPACKAVLVGLANHAGPGGREAFPSVRTLVRYTELSERTVRTALDRLEAHGMIRPCDPAVVAAKSKRADHRPQGWDLAMDLIRDDLDGDETGALARQFPGLATRTGARDGGRGDGVQRLHPAPEAPVDNAADEVERLHPAAATGCNHRSDGVQPFPQRGAAVAPEPSIEPSREPSAARAHPRGTALAVDKRRDEAAAGRYFDALGGQWRLTATQRDRLTPAVEAALADGWAPDRLAEFTGANSADVRNPYALSARLSPHQLPAGPGPPSARPPWCGLCAPDSRFLLDERGYPSAVPCLRCRPGVVRERGWSAEAHTLKSPEGKPSAARPAAASA
jgi:Helix-turn-helix domain